LQAESKRLDALALENKNKQNAAENRLREENEKLKRELEARKKEEAMLIKEGALVYIKSSQGHYITNKVLGSWYTSITKDGADKAKFKVSYGNIACTSSHVNSGIRLEHQGANQYRYLYASTGDARYVRYDVHSENTKQLWQPQLAVDGRVLGDGTLKYDTEIILRDCYVVSVMCACKRDYDTNYEYLCSQYENAKGYLDTSKPGHCKTWYLERAV